MSTTIRRRFPTKSLLLLTLALGWGAREVAFARQGAAAIKSATVNLEEVKMSDLIVDGKNVGRLGVYVKGDTPESSLFVTGRLVLNAGQTPHPPHVHPEEEVMVIESGHGDIFCDGKTTKIGPGSVMYTTPNASHGIVNTGDTPLVFYFIKWAGKGKPAG